MPATSIIHNETAATTGNRGGLNLVLWTARPAPGKDRTHARIHALAANHKPR